jgi:hypothetical protein
LALAEKTAALVKRLPRIMKGEDTIADADEGLVAGRLCYDKGLYVAATRLWMQALERDPKRAADRLSQPRYNLACAAARAGCGKSRDDPPPDEAARKRLRDQAREWLTAELTEWSGVLASARPRDRRLVLQVLRHWKQDADLAGIRDAEALEKLPEEEQKAWQSLWSDTENLLKKAKP